MDSIGKYVAEDEYERCWQTGEYEDQYCANCPHNNDCNGEDEDD